MFCSECGQKTEGEFCENCGAPVGSPRRNPKVLYGIIGGLVLVALVIGVVLLLGGGGSGPEATVKNMFKALETGDVDLLFKQIDLGEYGEFAELMKPMMAEVLQEASVEMKAMNAKYSILGSRVDGDHAEVDVRLTTNEGTEEETIDVYKRDGKWYVDFDGFSGF